jgi:hypothetical protein
MRSLTLPPRKIQQNLHAYVREHLPHLERVLCTGVPYTALAEAVLAAGFSKVPIRSIQNAVYQARKKQSTDGCSVVSRGAADQPQYGSSVWRGEGAAEAGNDGTAGLRRRFEELVRGPRPGSGEADELV